MSQVILKQAYLYNILDRRDDNDEKIGTAQDAFLLTAIVSDSGMDKSSNTPVMFNDALNWRFSYFMLAVYGSRVA